MNRGLKPCPFCGGRAVLHTAFDGSKIVQCTKCACSTPYKWDEKSVMQDWNRRYNSGGWREVEDE